MPSRQSSSGETDAYAVARRLHQITEDSRRSFDTAASDLGLTAPQARSVLRLFEPTAMGDIAEHLACDASNVTGIVSRLSAHGLVTVSPGPDRRVKVLELTARGQQVRAELEQRVAGTAPAMTRLNKVERRALLQLLDKLVGPEGERSAAESR
jgi:DNA-binding MarR family transcriptional regulator